MEGRRAKFCFCSKIVRVREREKIQNYLNCIKKISIVFTGFKPGDNSSTAVIFINRRKYLKKNVLLTLCYVWPF